MLQENKETNNTEKLTWEAPTVSTINTDATDSKSTNAFEVGGGYGPS